MIFHTVGMSGEIQSKRLKMWIMYVNRAQSFSLPELTRST